MINSYAGLIIPGLVGVTNIFLMKQFFETIPKDLEQAALIDGCSYFRIFWQVFSTYFKTSLGRGGHLHLSRLMERISMASNRYLH